MPGFDFGRYLFGCLNPHLNPHHPAYNPRVVRDLIDALTDAAAQNIPDRLIDHMRDAGRGDLRTTHPGDVRRVAACPRPQLQLLASAIRHAAEHSEGSGRQVHVRVESRVGTPRSVTVTLTDQDFLEIRVVTPD